MNSTASTLAKAQRLVGRNAVVGVGQGARRAIVFFLDHESKPSRVTLKRWAARHHAQIQILVTGPVKRASSRCTGFSLSSRS